MDTDSELTETSDTRSLSDTISIDTSNSTVTRKRDYFWHGYYPFTMEDTVLEKIIICLDLCVEHLVFRQLICHIRMFLNLKKVTMKKKLENRTEFALIVLESSKATLEKDFCSPGEIEYYLKRLKEQPLKDTVFDLSSLYKTIIRISGEIPDYVCTGHLIRPIIYYGRDNICIPEFVNAERPIFEKFLSPLVFVDLVRIVEEKKMSENKITDENFYVTGKMEEGETVEKINIVDVYLQASSLGNNFVRCLRLLLGHPFLRPRLPGYQALMFTQANDVPPIPAEKLKPKEQQKMQE